MTRRRKHWGWGYEDQHPSLADLRAAAPRIRERLRFGGEPEEPRPLEEIELPAPRLDAPRSLAALISEERHERVSHALGKAYRDVVRGMRGEIEHPPDLVARPRNEAELEAVLAWCSDAGAAAIPFGGGTSVVGGVEPRVVGAAYAGVVTIDLAAFDRVLEVDRASRAARVQAGFSARRSTTSSPQTASRCATSRSRSSTRRSAAGSRPGPGDTSRPSGPTSTTSSRRCVRFLPQASGRAGACPDREPARAPTGC